MDGLAADGKVIGNGTNIQALELAAAAWQPVS
jgi:hypothetical protein